jgi:ATP-dependent Lon protease
VATANTLDPIPSPLRDRFRIVSFPKPSRADVDVLLPALLRSFAGDRQLDDRWIAPVGPDERVVIAEAWRGGSVRRLRRILEAILRTRDQSARRH